MRKEKIILAFVIIGVFLTAGSKAAGESQGQEEQLKDIENYISQQRRKIEDYYADRQAELQLKRDAEIRVLDVADKEAFATLAAQARIAEAVLGIKEAPKPKGSIEDMIDKSPRHFAAAQSQIAEEKNNIFAGYDCEAARLERQKRYALNIRLPELKEYLKESLSAEKPKPAVGVISGILYSERKPAAIIGGQIVHQGETIHKVKVAKIYPDKVEFEKNGDKWEQKTAEPAEAFW
jgi:type II secretory pathway pseudopilin PulG